MKKGKFIVLEGIDGSGTTTHSNKLANWIRSKNLEVMVTEEPTVGAIGKIIRKYLFSGEGSPPVHALLFAADRAEHTEKVIKPSIISGIIVISDRYVESSIVYQAAEGLDIEWIEAINKFAIEPDLTIFLDVDPGIALARKREVREKFENIEFLKEVRRIYLERIRVKNFPVIDASRPIEVVHEDIVRCVESFLFKT
ncbi:MAG: dTMP kinase [Candidatus Jordarchaeum sp.]|uniref:dTMP kinase n=1 Tax=Candidatus Jordarchaeum sp. TaxID=2823881 RepID=UPI00404AB1BE